MSNYLTLYLDETGVRNPERNFGSAKDQPYFALGGVIVGGKEKKIVQAAVDAFKKSWNIL